MKTIVKLFAGALLLAITSSSFAEVHYVDVNGTNATPPYTNWSTAATYIQDAVNVAVADDEIVVTNGIYYPVRVGMSLKLRTVNGPQFTTIDGYVGGVFQNLRCAYLASGASLSGFTLINGNDRYNNSPYGGGGVFCESVTAVVSNCVITGNRATGLRLDGGFGGGAYGGTLNNCTLSYNNASVRSGYTAGDILAYGGGAYGSTLNNCTMTSNSVTCLNSGGGHYAFGHGGGAYQCVLNNCTLIGNQAIFVAGYGGSTAGGGVYGSTLNNCILMCNSVSDFSGGGSGIYGGNYVGGMLTYCCTTPDPGGIGNITNAPLFADLPSGNLRLQPNSPCINAGNNSYVTNATDLDGNPRTAGGTVDIGAYEFQSPASMISYAWLQQFNLPINPATDTADPDGDGVNNYHEWLAHSDPTNPFSFPPLLTLIHYGANIVLTWPTNAVGFTLQSTTNLHSPAAWVTNSPAPVVINGQNTVTNPISGAQQFYRLRQ
jgi:hypothetical protein